MRRSGLSDMFCRAAPARRSESSCSVAWSGWSSPSAARGSDAAVKEEKSHHGVHRVPADVELAEVGAAVDHLVVVGVLEEDVDGRVLDARPARLREKGGRTKPGCQWRRCGSPSR